MCERAMVIVMTQFAFGNIEDMVDSVWMAQTQRDPTGRGELLIGPMEAGSWRLWQHHGCRTYLCFRKDTH